MLVQFTLPYTCPWKYASVVRLSCMADFMCKSSGVVMLPDLNLLEGIGRRLIPQQRRFAHRHQMHPRMILLPLSPIYNSNYS